MLRRAIPILLAATASVTFAHAVSADERAPPHHRPVPPPWDDPPPVAATFQADIVDAGGASLPAFAHRGQRWVMGTLGQRYRIRLRNPTSARVEAVVSVDGLDAVDGRSASLEKRGYVLPPFGEITVEGFRTSLDTVAAFRFSSVRDSYAGRKGQDRNVGVIGVAFFRERAPVVVRPPHPKPWWRGGGDSAEGAASGRAAPAPAAAAPRKEREGIGTAFGEQRESRVSGTSFVRESAWPAARLEVRYDDRDGLRAMGIRVDPDPIAWGDEAHRRRTADPFPADRRFATPPP
jgi:hypothetical protein